MLSQESSAKFSFGESETINRINNTPIEQTEHTETISEVIPTKPSGFSKIIGSMLLM